MSFLHRMIFIKPAKIKAYVLYAVGELFLIVCGIYIALQLDDWKRVKEQQANEVEILAEIATAFERDVLDINFNINLHENAIRSGEIILAHLENGLPYADSLSNHFAKVLWYSRMGVVKGAFDNLKTKGSEVISNDTLRLKIISMYDIRYETIQKLELNTFLHDAYILQIHATRFDKTELYKPFRAYDVLPGNMVPHNYEKLKTDKDYLHVVKSTISKNKFLVEVFMRPTLREVKSLKEEVLNERRRLLSSYDINLPESSL